MITSANFVFHHEVPRFGSVEYNLYMISTNAHIDCWALIFGLIQEEPTRIK